MYIFLIYCRVLFFVVAFVCTMLIVLFKQKTAYEMRISDWSSDVCSSDLSTALRVSSIEAFCGRFKSTRISGRSEDGKNWFCTKRMQIGRASCRERVCQYV